MEDKPKIDLSTGEGVLRFAEAELERAREMFLADGRLYILFIVLANHDLEGRPLDGTTAMLMPSQFMPTDDKDTMARLVRMVVKKTNAVGVITIAETWYLEPQPGVRRDELPESLADHPDSIECIFATLEHCELGIRQWQAKITRGANGLVSVGDYVAKELHLRGRMTGFLGGSESDPLVS